MLKNNITLNIGLSSWIIQDGNYGDFQVGQEASFALEFGPLNGARLGNSDRQLSFSQIRDASYQVTAKVVSVVNETWVIDFGVLAYRDNFLGFRPKVGDFLVGEIYLGIDPFFYFESLYKDKAIPNLIYKWKIDSIKRETAPLIEANDLQKKALNMLANKKVFIRDPMKLKMIEISRTDAWKDDDGCAEYVLVSELLQAEPRRSLSGD